MVFPVNFPEFDSEIPPWWPKVVCALCKKEVPSRETAIDFSITTDLQGNKHHVWQLRNIGLVPPDWEYMKIGRHTQYTLPVCHECVERVTGK